MFDKSDIIEIYTDRNQCREFGVSYYDLTAELIISARTLCESKSYDKEHQDILKSFGSATLVLTRTEEQCPGWWHVTDVIR